MWKGHIKTVAFVLAVVAAVTPLAALIFVVRLLDPPPTNDGFDPPYIAVGLFFLASFPLGFMLGRAVWRSLRKQ